MAKKLTAAKVIAPKPYRAKRFGILNHVGGIWSPETFSTEAEAQQYLDKQRLVFSGGLPKHKVVPVRVTISIARFHHMIEQHPFDVCYCGDYRHQHEGGKGRCKLGGLCTPSPCQRFRYVQGPSDEDRKKPEPNEAHSR